MVIGYTIFMHHGDFNVTIVVYSSNNVGPLISRYGDASVDRGFGAVFAHCYR